MVADSRFTPEDPEAMKTVDIISVIFSTGIKFQVCGFAFEIKFLKFKFKFLKKKFIIFLSR